MNRMLSVPVAVAILAAFVAGLFLPAAHAQDEIDPRDEAAELCAAPCEINIRVPADSERSPRVSAEFVRLRPGQELSWQSNRSVTVVFPNQTPFVGPTGRPIYKFDVETLRRVRVRNDGGEQCRPPGCNFIIVDAAEDRPPSPDVWIIIDR